MFDSVTWIDHEPWDMFMVPKSTSKPGLRIRWREVIPTWDSDAGFEPVRLIQWGVDLIVYIMMV